ncbi:MAG: hypothetical protein LBP87_14750 [Planctomycetaceae bacterium]|jgi:hypothetical protein|nr:hypothetical protein [Planctomycetaceae bacterium]
MSSEPNAIHDISSDEAILVEYLDGELSLQDRQIVENRLAAEPEFRETLAQLEESWRLLDLLKHDELNNEINKELVESTLETVVFSEEQNVAKIQHRTKWRFSGKTALIGFLFLLCFAFSFRLGESLAPDKNFWIRIASPIIDRLDMYLTVIDDDPELLQFLAERRLFLPPLPAGTEPINPNEYRPSSSIRILDSLTVYHPSFSELKRRVKRIENLDESLYNRFYNNCKKFQDLSWDKKQKLRKLHESIERSPRRYELFQTLQNYYNWRKSLQSYEKTELRRPLPAAERVEQIAALKSRLDANQPETVAVPLLSEILQLNADLAKVLDRLSMQEKEILLNTNPAQIIAILLKQLDTEKKNNR